MKEQRCVDEQIVPFKAKNGLKQYKSKKRKRWGYKIYVLTDSSVIAYNFEVHTGPILPINGMPDIGESGNIVLQLASIVPDNQYHKLFFDNWFTSVNLQTILEKKKIQCVGTVRPNRLAGCSFSKDKDMGRGTFEEKAASHDGVQLRAVKWHDNHADHLLFTFASANQTTSVQRWDKSKKAAVHFILLLIVSLSVVSFSVFFYIAP